MPSGESPDRRTRADAWTALRKDVTSSMDLLLPLILLVPLGLLIYQQRKRARAFAALQSQLTVGQTVMTSAGMYGEVVSIDGDVMVLEVAPGVQLRWNKGALGRIVADDERLGEAHHVDDTQPGTPVADDSSPEGTTVADAPPERRGPGPDLSKS